MKEDVHAPEDVAVTSEQLRLRMRSLVDPLCGVIEAAADQVIASTTNAAVRREGLLWKIEAVPALRQCLFQPDPGTALFDTWVLSCQMEEYFETGAGREKLADVHPIAVATCQRLEFDLARLAASMTKSGDVTDARAFVRKWAKAHPIQTSIAARESTLSRATDRDLVSRRPPKPSAISRLRWTI